MKEVTCPRCGNLLRIYEWASYDSERCYYCGTLVSSRNMNTDEPPLGAKPCYIHAEQRIEDLSNAILRNIGSGKPKYDSIRKWAREIALQCELAEIVDGDNALF